MPAAAEGPDTEDLKISPFARGEWSQEERILLDVSFTSLAEVLGDEDDPLESIAVSRLLAIAYAVGWSSKMLMVSPADFAGELEAAIDARGGLQDIGNVADEILRKIPDADLKFLKDDTPTPNEVKKTFFFSRIRDIDQNHNIHVF